MYEIRDLGPLTAPLLIAAFEGWVSAGSVGTAAAKHIADDQPAAVVFDSDALYDYRVTRPTVDFVEGTMQQIEWPELSVRRRRIEDRDILVLTGVEPNWRWKELGSAVADLAASLGVVELVSLGGIPWAAPHTRPTAILTTASQRDLLSEDENYPEGLLRVPAAAVNVVERSLVDQGIPAVGFWARVPHYVGGVYYPGVVSIVERVARHAGVAIPLGSLVDDAADQRRRLDAAIAERPEAVALVERLEALADAQGEVASGEQIAAEIERFLRETTEGEEPFAED
jgi:hypothetical protein